MNSSRPAYDVRGCTVVLVDEMATGASMRAAVAAVKQLQAAHPIIAVPVVASTTCDELAAQGNQAVCPLKLDILYSVGSWYGHFDQTSAVIQRHTPCLNRPAIGDLTRVETLKRAAPASAGMLNYPLRASDS